MSSRLPRYDAVIAGGGPAGAAAGRLLARWGHEVIVLTRAESASEPSLAESLPPSCARLFDVLGVLDAVEGSAVYRSTGNTVWWGDAEARSASFADGTSGYQVLRRDFDRLLRDLAADAGATVVRDATVRAVERAGPESDATGIAGGGRRVEYRDPSGTRRSVEARFVLDCSGRAGVVARQGLRRYERRQTTLALVGVWRRADGWPLEDETHTLVETYADGWAWSVPVSRATRYFTVMVDPRLTDLDRSPHVSAVYRREIDKTRRFSALVAGATPQGRPWACDASLYSARRYAGPGFLLVGDAASFIDPLSSFGVKKALASAWRAAVVVHTSLTNPAMTGPALELFATREQEVYASHLTQSARYFEEAAGEHRHPFWTGRASAAEAVDAGTREASDIERLRCSPAVLEAFEALKRSPAIALGPTGRLRIERKPGIAGREVVLEDRVVLPDWPSGPASIRFLRGVDLPRLVRMAGQYDQVPDLFEAYNQACAPVILPDFLGALSVLLANEVIRNSP